MSTAALVALSPESKSATRSSSKTLRVNEPGDAYEREADKVADTVAGGGRISHWSLSSSGAGLIQRDPNTAASIPTQPPIRMIGDSQEPPAPNNYSDALGKLAEALKETPAGKAVIKYLTDQPIVKEAKDFVETPAGIAVVGTTAIATIAGLAAKGKSLPMQIPQLPLGTIAGIEVKAKIDVEGPLNHPTQGSLMFSFGSAPAKKKKDSLTKSEKYRAQTARMAEEMKFGAGVDPSKLGPLASTDALEKQADDKRAQSYAASRMSGILQPSAPHTPGQFTPLVPGTQPMSLGMRDDISAADTATPAASKDTSKKEEIPVQRKAESMLDILPDAADVDSVLNSNGQPLDRETRRTMESRIGFDFSKVRIHTDSHAGASARMLRARAYTVGNDVVFAPGRFAPQTTEGRRLLAHELTHVVQQSPNRAAMPPAIRPAPVQIQREAEEEPGRIQKLISQIPGYTLFTVIIGYDPLQRKDVERNPIAIVREFLKLIHKENVFKDLEQSHTLEDASHWLEERVNKLNFSKEGFTQIGKDALKAIATNFLSGFDATVRSVQAVFEPIVRKLLDLAGEVITKVGEFLFKFVMKEIGGEEILATLAKAQDSFQAIIKNPIGFLKNLFESVKQGFLLFQQQAVENLKNGLVKWLSDELKSAGITLPKTFNLKEIGGIVLQVFGITKENLRKLVADEIGEEELARIEKGVEGGLEIFKEVQEQGPIALWNRAIAYLQNITETIISSIQSWIKDVIIAEAIKHLAPLLTPIGAAIEAVLDIIKTAQIIFAQIKKLAALIKGIVDTVAEIAAGNVMPAAQKIVQTLVNAIPVVISFLVGYIGLKDIGKHIGETLETVRKPIREAVSKVIKFAADKARAVIAKGKQTVKNVVQWWKQRKKFKVGNESHEVHLEGSGDHPEVIVESSPTPLERYLVIVKATDEQKQEIFALVKKLKWTTEDERPQVSAAKKPEDGASIFDQIVEKLSKLKPTNNLVIAPPTFVKKQVTNSFGGGEHADVFLSLVQPKGTEPENTSPHILEDLGKDLIKQKSYIRGHLLSQKLGGLGIWANMMPITNSANQTMERRIERLVNKAAGTGEALIHYTVDAEYDETIKDDPITPQRAEQRLKRLRWKSNPAAFENNQWKDTTVIPKDKDGKDIPGIVSQDDLDPKQTKATPLP